MAKGSTPGSNYFDQLRISCGEETFLLKISIPQEIKFLDIVENVHGLTQERLLLEHTQDLGYVAVEFFEYALEPTIIGNGIGTVEIQKDVIISGKTYAVVGYVDANFYYASGSTSIKGYFWSENATW